MVLRAKDFPFQFLDRIGQFPGSHFHDFFEVFMGMFKAPFHGFLRTNVLDNTEGSRSVAGRISNRD